MLRHTVTGRVMGVRPAEWTALMLGVQANQDGLVRPWLQGLTPDAAPTPA